ncbi:hypothetical protein [Actinocorallia libanotica]|uniref:Uncharacterized protein n=1 Tax=Actinocorallia libanotica TaxID=46162 RepID=A0ABN1R540_9ACTN
MSESPSIDHHRDIGYAEARATADQPFTVTADPDGDGMVVQGVCPACRTFTEFAIGRGIVGTKGRRRASAPAPAEITVFCMCGHVHAERPPEATDRGCGRFWKVRLP